MRLVGANKQVTSKKNAGHQHSQEPETLIDEFFFDAQIGPTYPWGNSEKHLVTLPREEEEEESGQKQEKQDPGFFRAGYNSTTCWCFEGYERVYLEVNVAAGRNNIIYSNHIYIYMMIILQ